MENKLDPTLALKVLRAQLKLVNATEEDYVLFGSIPMWFNGLRDEGVGDIDVFVTREIYDRLAEKSWWHEERPREDDPPFLALDTKPPINAFYDWTKRDDHMDVERNFREAQTSEDGWRYAPLTEVIKWKVEAGRPKDHQDIEAIEDFLVERQD